MAVLIPPDFGSNDEQVKIVCWRVLARHFPSPQNLLEQILTDTDLHVLGAMI